VNGGRDAVIRFGRFRILARRRELAVDGVPIELGTRAFDLLLVLLEADGSLVTKNAYEPCVARHRSCGGEPEGLDLRVARLLAKTAILFGPSSAGAIDSLPQFVRPLPGMLVSARHD